MARYSLNFEKLSPIATRGGCAKPVSARRARNPFKSIIVRAVEVLYACDEALRIIDEYEPPDCPAIARRAARCHRLRLHRSPARPALPPLSHRRPTG